MLRLARRAIVAPRAVAVTSCATTTTTRHACLNAYSMFMKQVWKSKTEGPLLRNMKSAVKSGKYIGALYKKLPADEKAKLAAAGAKIKRKSNGRKKGYTRKPSKWNKFVGKMCETPSIKKLPHTKRFAAIAKLYKK